MKTSELIGLALDWAVSKCENPEWGEEGWLDGTYHDDDGWIYNPSTNWLQGGPIIDREGFNLCKCNGHWEAITDGYIAVGNTLLIAAMRCLVYKYLGADIQIPIELQENSNEL